MQAYRSIMVHVPVGVAHGGQAQGRIALAADLADRFNASLIGIAAGAVQLSMVMADAGATLVQIDAMQSENLTRSIREAELRFRGALPRLVQEVEWRSFAELPARAVTREARSADLIVLGRSREESRIEFEGDVDPGDVLMDAGRPCLVVPPRIGVLNARRVLVGWTDRREARRAVADALPLLCRADAVRVLEVREDSQAVRLAAKRAAEVAAYLRRHDVPASGEACALGEHSIADQLIAAAREFGADLIVSGGYGHARLREWIFGGVTRALIRRAPCCCLLSH